MKKSKKTVYYRRKRDGVTNYKKRLKLLLSDKLRLVVRKSLNNIAAQVIEYNEKGDLIILSAHSSQLKKIGWDYPCGNLPSAYLTGLLLGKKANEKKIKEVILDAGMHKPTNGSKIYAVVKGVLDAGINIPCSKEVLPSEDRIEGKHIEKYASVLKGDSDRYKKQFGKCLKTNIDPNEFSKNFNLFKKRLLEGKNEK